MAEFSVTDHFYIIGLPFNRDAHYISATSTDDHHQTYQSIKLALPLIIISLTLSHPPRVAFIKQDKDFEND
jgi:hypothetical protein